MIRKACYKDIPKIADLLCQVDLVHHNGRPDIFKVGRKYSDLELERLIKGKKQEEIINEKYRVMALEGSTQTRALKIKQNCWKLFCLKI